MQVQQYRLQLLDKRAAAQQARQRTQGASLAAAWQAQAADAAQRQRAARAAALEPSELQHVLPVQDEEGHTRAARRAKAVDYAEDLRVQLAREQVWQQPCQ